MLLMYILYILYSTGNGLSGIIGARVHILYFNILILNSTKTPVLVILVCKAVKLLSAIYTVRGTVLTCMRGL